MKALITGTSSGLGRALADAVLRRDGTVWGLSRRGSSVQHNKLRDARVDLSDLDALPQALDSLLADCARLDLVVLNAAVLGRIAALHETPLHDLERIMRVNVWSNKIILDWLIAREIKVAQIVAISSGAAVSPQHGWGGYALSKVALNHLVSLYATELPTTHFTALAPGLVDTAMQDYLCEEVDSDRFASVRKLQDARGTDAMPSPAIVAARILDLLPALRGCASGGFADLRKLPECAAGA